MNTEINYTESMGTKSRIKLRTELSRKTELRTKPLNEKKIPGRETPDLEVSPL